MLGYFPVFDLLGFGAIIRNSAPVERTERIESWLALVDEATAASPHLNRQVISDTLFMAADDSEAGLASVLDAARILLNRGMPASLPVRGAIVHGDYTWGERLTYGQAVIDAHELERSVEWVGVTCAADLPRVERFWDYDQLVVYPPPFKTGDIRLHPVLTWEVPRTRKLMSQLSSHGLMAAGETFRWEIGAKLNNTSQFGAYLSIARAKGLEPDRFKPFLPFRILEEAALESVPKHALAEQVK
ncbi:MAG: hypothetical protein ABI748_09210 [Dokdonella sp.]